MIILTRAVAAAAITFGTVMLSASVATAAQTAAPAVDPAAVATLQRMTKHLDSVARFSVHTENLVEDVDAAGHRIDSDMSAEIIIRRPDGMRAMRTGATMDQQFYYDGKTLSLFSPSANVYATIAAPPTLDGMITLAREHVGIVLPAADLLYSNAFALLTQGLTQASVVGKAVVGGVRSDHLLFSRPGADFQLWVAEGSTPWPVKYVVTDTSTPARLSIGTVFSNWNPAPRIDAATFDFVPPKGASATRFLPVQSAVGEK